MTGHRHEPDTTWIKTARADGKPDKPIKKHSVAFYIIIIGFIDMVLGAAVLGTLFGVAVAVFTCVTGLLS